MSQESIVDDFGSPVSESSRIDYDAVIHQLIKDKGCSYPAEMQREIGCSKDTLYMHLHSLCRDKILKRHSLSGKTSAPDWIKPRIPELITMGIKGDRIRAMAWYTLVDAEVKPSKTQFQHEQDYDNNMLALDAEMNRERGVEPSEKQLEAEKIVHGNL